MAVLAAIPQVLVEGSDPFLEVLGHLHQKTNGFFELTMLVSPDSVWSPTHCCS